MTTPRRRSQTGVLVDASAYYALIDADDRWHRLSVDAWQRLRGERRPLYTTNLVVAETHALIQRRFGGTRALEWLRSLRGTNMAFQAEGRHRQIERIIERQPDIGYSCSDCFSFLVMQELGLDTAFTFDRHFSQYGWSVFPGQAL